MSGALEARLRARVGSLQVDVALDTGPGTLVLVGPNGAGKSTVLSLLLGALRVEEGRVAVGGEVLLDTALGVEVPLEHRRLGYVPQDYALFPHLTVAENLAFALASGPGALDRAGRDQRVVELLGELALGVFRDRRPETLSGGERQRVAIARALAASPRALLLDEPLAALDVHARADVRRFLRDTLERLALPTVLITHDAADARLLGHRVAVLEAGGVTQVGPWQALVEGPATPFVASFARGAPLAW